MQSSAGFFVVSLDKFLSTIEWPVKWDALTPMMRHPDLFACHCLNTTVFFDSRSHVLTKVSQAIEAKDVLAEDPVYQETLHHSFSCQKYVKVFQGRQDLVDRIRNYVQGTSAEPLLVYGYSGCGKTSLMAKAYSMVNEKRVSSDTGLWCFLWSLPEFNNLLTHLCNVLANVTISTFSDVLC